MTTTYWMRPLTERMTLTNRSSEPAPTAADSGTSGLSIPPVDLRWLRGQMDCALDLPDLLAPDGKTPFGYQRVGMAGVICTPRMILADDVGLGKALIMLGAVRWMLHAGVIQTVVIVTIRPAMLQMAQEAAKWFGDALRVDVIRGTKAQRQKQYARIRRKHGHVFDHTHLVVTSYPLLRNDLEELQTLPFQMVVFDEAHNLKNFDAQQTRAAKKLVANVSRVLEITATPIQNGLEEYWSLMHIMNEDVLGSRDRFLHEFCRMGTVPIMYRGHRKYISVIKGYTNLEQFKREVSPHVLMRTTEEVNIQLPEVRPPVDRWLDMTAQQLKRYEEVEHGIMRLDPSQPGTQLQAIQMVTRLAQIANAVGLVFPGESGSSKIDELRRLMTHELAGKQVLVFSKSLEFIKQYVQPMLADAGISFHEISGAVDIDTMERGRQRFQAGDIQVITLTTAGEAALNLDAASHLVCMDQIYNPGRMRQLVGRIRRASSQHASVGVIRLLMRDSIEERVMDLLGQRSAIIDFLDDPSDYSTVQMADLMKLVSKDISLLDRSH